MAKLIETCTRIYQNESLNKSAVDPATNLDELKSRVNHLVSTWRDLLTKLADQQAHLSSRLDAAHSLTCDLQDTLNWLESSVEKEHHLTSISTNKLYGGLPETARDQRDKFLRLVCTPLSAAEPRVLSLLESASAVLSCSNKSGRTKADKGLDRAAKQLAVKWPQVKRRVEERRERLEKAVQEVIKKN